MVTATILLYHLLNSLNRAMSKVMQWCWWLWIL